MTTHCRTQPRFSGSDVNVSKSSIPTATLRLRNPTSLFPPIYCYPSMVLSRPHYSVPPQHRFCSISLSSSTSFGLEGCSTTSSNSSPQYLLDSKCRSTLSPIRITPTSTDSSSHTWQHHLTLTLPQTRRHNRTFSIYKHIQRYIPPITPTSPAQPDAPHSTPHKPPTPAH